MKARPAGISRRRREGGPHHLHTLLQAAVKPKRPRRPSRTRPSSVAIRLGVDPRKVTRYSRHGQPATALVRLPATRYSRLVKGRCCCCRGGGCCREDDLIESDSGRLVDPMPRSRHRIRWPVGRTLGCYPRGLMPNPKNRTVTADVAKAVADIKGRQDQLRADKQANPLLPESNV